MNIFHTCAVLGWLLTALGLVYILATQGFGGVLALIAIVLVVHWLDDLRL